MQDFKEITKKDPYFPKNIEYIKKMIQKNGPIGKTHSRGDIVKFNEIILTISGPNENSFSKNIDFYVFSKRKVRTTLMEIITQHSDHSYEIHLVGTLILKMDSIRRIQSNKDIILCSSKKWMTRYYKLSIDEFLLLE